MGNMEVITITKKLFAVCTCYLYKQRVYYYLSERFNITAKQTHFQLCSVFLIKALILDSFLR